MRAFIFAMLTVCATSAVADRVDPPLPALYAVTGVAADDRLNVRAGPDVASAAIGSMAPGLARIEVVDLSLSGRWGLINTAETAGWVAMRYLEPLFEDKTELGLPVGLRCFGTEPFWNIGFGDGKSLTLSTPEADTDHAITMQAPDPANVNLAEGGFLFAWRQSRAIVTARILPGQCSDGMSDRQYGLHYVDDQGLRKGCCRLQ